MAMKEATVVVEATEGEVEAIPNQPTPRAAVPTNLLSKVVVRLAQAQVTPWR